MSGTFLSRASPPLAALLVSLSAFASVDPSEVELQLAPGESEDVDTSVTVPEVPPKLDFVLLVDLSGSYNDDLENIQLLMPALGEALVAEVGDIRFGLGTFIDYPCSPWGAEGDYAYRRDLDLTADQAAWEDALGEMETGFGADYPESQYAGLFQAVMGIGDSGGTCPEGAIPAGQDFSFRGDATRIIAITTDAVFHDSDTDLSYPGPGADETIGALEDAGVKVIAIQAPLSGADFDPTLTAQMEELASATGGALVTTSSTSAEIATAIIAGIEQLRFDVYPEADPACDPLEISWSPDLAEDVLSGEETVFVETVLLPEGADEDDLGGCCLSCDVRYYADDTEIGTQGLTVCTDTRGPEIDCNAPATITPPDAPVSYTATATDECGEVYEVEVVDYECWRYTGSGRRVDTTASCRFSFEGDTVTIRNSGGVGHNIRWTIVATDTAGNESEQACTVEVTRPGAG